MYFPQIFSVVLSSPNAHAPIDFWDIFHPAIVVFPAHSYPSMIPVYHPLRIFVTQKDSLNLNVETHKKARTYNGYQQQLLFFQVSSNPMILHYLPY